MPIDKLFYQQNPLVYEKINTCVKMTIYLQELMRKDSNANRLLLTQCNQEISLEHKVRTK